MLHGSLGEFVEAAPALRHRLVATYEGEASGAHPDAWIAQALEAARAAG